MGRKDAGWPLVPLERPNEFRVARGQAVAPALLIDHPRAFNKQFPPACGVKHRADLPEGKTVLAHHNGEVRPELFNRESFAHTLTNLPQAGQLARWSVPGPFVTPRNWHLKYTLL